MRNIITMDQDIFYDTAVLSFTEQKTMLHKAHTICDKWWFDKLDCSESFARQLVKEISFKGSSSL